MTNFIPNASRGTAGTPRKGLSKSTYIWLGVATLVLLLFVGGCTSFNSMKKSEIEVDKTWGDVQSSYQRRLQLIPNLVNTVKGAAAHEKDVQLGVTQSRTGINPGVEKAEKELLAAAQGANPGQFSPDGQQSMNTEAYSKFDNAYRLYINAVHEAYPNITANENFKGLQDELAGTENRIDHARVKYNEAVQKYNTAIGLFPKNIFAGIFGFQSKQMFQADAGAMNAPEVDFSK